MIEQLEEMLAVVREDFTAATVPDGGLLLHLPSGDFFPLGRVESAVWDAIFHADTAAATVAATAAALDLSALEAGRLLARVVARAQTVSAGGPATGPRFWEDEHTLSLVEGSQTHLSLDKGSLVLTAAEQLEVRNDDEIAELLRVFVPKLFGRWYPLALHASAVGIGDRTLLFCGKSGAGKTTTARVLAEEISGARLFSEDVVLLANVDGVLMMVQQAETAIQSWMIDATRNLVEQRRRICEAAPLRRALDALTVRQPLHKVVFLDADRRAGRSWSLASPPPSVTLGRLFLNSFFHSIGASALKDHLRTCRKLTLQIEAAEATVIPSGVDALRSSSRDQISTIAA